MQRNLNRFLPPTQQLTVNGKFDGPTEKKHREWQKTRLIPATSQGVVGPGTWDMLFAPRFLKNLKQGSKDKTVRQLKVALNRFSDNHLKVDDEAFDGPTNTAVRNWQDHRGQHVDDVVDMLTWYWIHAPHVPADKVPELHPG